jgi:hypothetical protein
MGLSVPAEEDPMRVVKAFPLSLVLLAGVARADSDNLLKANQFRGSVPGVTIGNVASGGRPWVIESASAKLDLDGTFKVEVEGLVFAPGTIIGGVDVGGTTGAVRAFAAALVCTQADGTTTTVNTAPFPATTTGDGQIKTKIDVPPVCYAPAVLVRNATNGVLGNWFAVTGF